MEQKDTEKRWWVTVTEAVEASCWRADRSHAPVLHALDGRRALSDEVAVTLRGHQSRRVGRELPSVRIEEIAQRFDLRVGNVFHAGDGNLHPKILFDGRNAEEVERVETASREIMALCVEVGGTITGEHGVGLDKKKYMRLVFGPDELSAMARVMEVFDPEDLFNPGKVLPDAAEVDA